MSFVKTFGGSPKVLWIASAGGHLAQTDYIEKLIGHNPDSAWVTFDVPQSRSLLHGRRAHFVDYVAPRDIVGAFRASSEITRVARSDSFDFCISTGAAIAAVGLPRIALTGVPTFYVESVARSEGPSLTGKMMRVAPRVRTLTQYPSWATRSWTYRGSILDYMTPVTRDNPVSGPRNIFVTLGTIRPYRFDRLVDAVSACLVPGDKVTWQLGITTRDDLPGVSFAETSGEEMDDLIAAADTVVTHSGVGSILKSLELGKIPVVAVRGRAHHEHVDDHQQGIAEVMSSRGLAYPLDLSKPDRSVFDAASQVMPLRG